LHTFFLSELLVSLTLKRDSCTRHNKSCGRFGLTLRCCLLKKWASWFHALRPPAGWDSSFRGIGTPHPSASPRGTPSAPVTGVPSRVYQRKNLTIGTRTTCPLARGSRGGARNAVERVRARCGGASRPRVRPSLLSLSVAFALCGSADLRVDTCNVCPAYAAFLIVCEKNGQAISFVGAWQASPLHRCLTLYLYLP
jgi:hypothetical protein